MVNFNQVVDDPSVLKTKEGLAWFINYSRSIRGDLHTVSVKNAIDCLNSDIDLALTEDALG